MGAAQREILPGDEDVETAAVEFALTEPALRGGDLRRQLAERVAEHRRRRGQGTAVADEAGQYGADGHEGARPRLSRPGRQTAIAEAVKERYAQTPSYRAFLAEQAQHAVEEAAARAEIARRNAEAAAAVQQELLMELELWEAPQEFRAEDAAVVENDGILETPGGEQSARGSRSTHRDETAMNGARGTEPGGNVGGLTVRLYEDLGLPMVKETRRPHAGGESEDAAERQVLDAEIAFRKAPVFEDYKAYLTRDAEPPIPLPANLLEFPRQLVAARRARPRLAEGPLREESPRTQQLRIFEVESEQISTAPVVEAVTEWAAIRLGAHTVTAAASAEGPHMAVMATQAPLSTAPMRLRAMAALVDGGLILLALAGFVAVFAKLAGEVPVGVPAWTGLGVTAVAFSLVYQAMFFTLSDQTPGMRYARIGLCTFGDENPTRAAMRRRILAEVIAVCPLGLGLVWMLLDDDGLGWHDRISRMYQRAY